MSRAGEVRRGGLRTAMIAAALGIGMIVSMATGAAAMGGGSQDQGQPPRGSGDGTVQTPPAGGSTGTPQYDYWTFNSVAPQPGVGTQTCAGDNGSGGSYVGVRVRYRYPYGMTTEQVQNAIVRGQAMMDSLGITSLGSTCLYDGSYRTETLKCVLYSTAQVAEFTPATKTLASKTTYSAYGNGDHSIAACQDSRSEAYVDATPTEYGRYQLDAYSRVVNMIVQRTTSANALTGVWAPDKIVSVSGEYTTNPVSARAYLTCSGFHDGDPDRTWTWTESDCGGPTPVSGVTNYTCSAPSNPITFDGHLLTGEPQTGFPRNTAVFMHDGEPRVIRYEVPTISGPGLVSINGTSSRVLRDASSTPWRADASPSDQMIEVERVGGGNILRTDGVATDWVTGSLVSDWQVRAYWASAEGAPTVLRGQYSYQGTWERTSVKVTGYVNGQWVTEPVTVRVDASATCTTEPLSLSVVRAVNS